MRQMPLLATHYEQNRYTGIKSDEIPYNPFSNPACLIDF